jgi:hypothetical protein
MSREAKTERRRLVARRVMRSVVRAIPPQICRSCATRRPDSRARLPHRTQPPTTARKDWLLERPPSTFQRRGSNETRADLVDARGRWERSARVF